MEERLDAGGGSRVGRGDWREDRIGGRDEVMGGRGVGCWSAVAWLPFDRVGVGDTTGNPPPPPPPAPSVRLYLSLPAAAVDCRGRGGSSPSHSSTAGPVMDGFNTCRRMCVLGLHGYGGGSKVTLYTRSFISISSRDENTVTVLWPTVKLYI